MGTTYLVDGYNALWKILPAMPEDREVARRALVQAVGRALAGTTGDRAHLVFDTQPGSGLRGSSGREGPVSWEYATGSADDAICAWIRQHGGEDVLVVTDDRELRGRARQLGARGTAVAGMLDRASRTLDHGRPPTSPGARARPPLTARDFGLPSGPIDLSETDPDSL